MKSLSVLPSILALSLWLHDARSFTTLSDTYCRKVALCARKPGKAKRARPNNGSGFGAKSAGGKSAGDNDFSVFPALESNVEGTLVPAESEEITSEIYQRLDQIYGFPEFNYDEKAGLSMTDMLSTTSSNSPNIDELLNPSASMPSGNSEFDDLLAAATGGTVSAKPAKQKQESIDASSDLNRLRPFDNVRLLHTDPLILAVDDFFTVEECDQYVAASEQRKNKNVMKSRSPTVGKDAAAKAQRTSTTFYHMYKGVPELMSKASRLLGIDTIDRWEEPQTVRYRRNEKFTWHLDALGPLEQEENAAGQRTATLLVYLTDLSVEEGGSTLFRDLGGDEKYLSVQPKKGTALLFFPAAGGIPNCPFDIRTLHSGQVVSSEAVNEKWIAQLWLRQRTYSPTAPPGNRHVDALGGIADYCKEQVLG